MSTSNGNGKPLRFAALIRVSTEKQERKGESLRTQASQIEKAVAVMGGKIVDRYAGQEHATAGWEREQRDKMLADAEKEHKPFDAVIVAHEDRWSRDDTRSGQDLDRLHRAGIRFFVLDREQSLTDPTTRLYLGMSAVIGAYHARNQSKKSIDNRIARAKRGRPTCGKMPFGRTWDEALQRWAVDPAKQAMVEDVANRYISGESLPKLAKEYGVNHANLCKVLRERCGDKWEQEFRSDDLNIHEVVPTTVPRLLPEATIRAVGQRLEANRTYLHKPPVSKYEYLLGGRVFCAACGYLMTGQTNPNGKRYYRHSHHDRTRSCPLKEPRPWVRADTIEDEVVRSLFGLFGNPAAIERALAAAVPDCEDARKKLSRLEEELAKIGRFRDRVLGMIEKDAITDAQAESKLRELKERECGLRAEAHKLATTLANVPDTHEVRLFLERWECGGLPCVAVRDEYGNEYEGGNTIGTWILMRKADYPKLIQTTLTGNLPDGTPAGVYITPAGGARFGAKQFSYRIRGRLVDVAGGVTPSPSC